MAKIMAMKLKYTKDQMAEINSAITWFSEQLIECNLNLKISIDDENYEMAAFQRDLIIQLIDDSIDIFHQITGMDKVLLKEYFDGQDLNIKKEINIMEMLFDDDTYTDDEDEDK
jgi:hypothetical protein